MKTCPVGAEFFFPCGRKDRWTDRQTDMTKLTVALPNFANAPKNFRQNIPLFRERTHDVV